MRKSVLILLLGLLAVGSAGAQNWHRKVGAYPFIRYGDNRIAFPGTEGEGDAYDLLWRKMDTVLLYGRGNLRIVHIGGSHVQGGAWTQQFRRNLLLFRYGLDGGRGMVFPYAAAGTNTPSGYYTSATGSWTVEKCLRSDPSERLGVTGMAVSTADTAASVTVDLYERTAREWAPAFTFSTIDVLGYGSLEPVVLLDREQVRGVRDPARGLWHFDLPHFAEYATVRFTGYPGTFTLTGLYLDNPFNGITVSELGVNGAATASFLRCEDFRRDLALLRPDLVIFSISINDIQGSSFHSASFIDHYGSLIREVLAVNPRCAILLTTNNDSYRHGAPNPQGREAVRAFERLARDHRTGLWDLFTVMGGYGSMSAWEDAGLAQRDKVHFTPQGYDLVGNLMYNALMDAYRGHVNRLP